MKERTAAPNAEPDTHAAIDQLRALAMASGDRLSLADGPPHPDHKLLVIAAAALDAWKTGQKALAAWGANPGPHKLGFQSYKSAGTSLKQTLRACGKLRATTGAGIYAKALLARASITGAAHLSRSLAADLVDNPALRDTLWQPETVA